MEKNDELRGYLMGLEDGYVQAKVEVEEKLADMSRADMESFNQMHKQAHAFVDSKGKEFYHDFVETVNFNPDGTRSRGYSPAVGAKPRGRKADQELLTIDPVTKERWQWVRYDAERVHLNKPSARYVCTHLERGEEEQVVEDLAEIAAGDPSALDCHYTIRLCATCADEYQSIFHGRK
jgi:hypothetical protein